MRGQSNRVEAAGKGEYYANNDKRKPTDQCPGKDDGNWHDLRRGREAHGYRRGARQNQVLWVWSAWTFQAETVPSEPRPRRRHYDASIITGTMWQPNEKTDTKVEEVKDEAEQ